MLVMEIERERERGRQEAKGVRVGSGASFSSLRERLFMVQADRSA